MRFFSVARLHWFRFLLCQSMTSRHGTGYKHAQRACTVNKIQGGPQELIDRYMGSISHLKPGTQTNRLSVIRQFCLYLCQYQPKSYVPERRGRLATPPVFQPYILTLKEVRLLLDQARKLGSPTSPRWSSLATLFGLLFASGLRIGEALAFPRRTKYFSLNRLFMHFKVSSDCFMRRLTLIFRARIDSVSDT